MFRAVTVSSEYGSGGATIARSVAETLGWKLLDHSLIAAIARTAQIPLKTVRRYDECVDSWWHRFHSGGLRSLAINAQISPDDAQVFDAQTIAAFAEHIIRKAAERGGCVVVGRGAQCVLQDRPDVLHVFIYGPWEERVSRVRNRITLPQEDVTKLIRLTDHQRAKYVRTYYQSDWKDPHLYHMMISSQIGTGPAAAMIGDAVRYSSAIARVRIHMSLPTS
jgi:cytidylate kinase